MNTPPDNLDALLVALGPKIGAKVTKIDAARQQLRSAIWLWFNVGDIVAIYTLAYAAHEVLHRTLRSKGGSDLLFDSSLVKETNRKAFTRLIKDDANFFKHADQDFDPRAAILFAIIYLTPQTNERMIRSSTRRTDHVQPRRPAL